MRRVCAAVITAVLLLGTVGCGAGGESYPAVSVTVDGEPLVYSVEPRTWNGDRYVGESDFAHVYAEHSGFEAPFYTRGSEIIVDFGDHPPDSVTVTDDVINSKGELMYGYMETAPAFETYEDGAVRMHITKHVTSGRSCGFMADGRDYRGYRVTALFGEEGYAYTFILLSES